MAGEPSLFLVYKDFNTDEREGDSWHGAQAAADAAAVDRGADFSANQGAVTVPNGWEPGWIYHPVGDTWRLQDVDDLSELDQRKYSATSLLEALDNQEDDLLRLRGIPVQVRGRVQDVLAYARWSAYAVFTGTTYTAAQQIAWASAMKIGPTDAADLDMLIIKSSALTDAEVPTETSAWVSPVDTSRSALAGSKVASARWNTAVGDLTEFSPGNGAWIEDIT